MRTMPTVISANPAHSDLLPDDAIVTPIAPQGHIERCIDILVGGNLTADEQQFVARATKHNWTIRTIIDSLRNRRGMCPIPNDFNWTSLAA